MQDGYGEGGGWRMGEEMRDGRSEMKGGRLEGFVGQSCGFVRREAKMGKVFAVEVKVRKR